MEEPEIRPFESPERETIGEGSADLERLLQKAGEKYAKMREVREKRSIVIKTKLEEKNLR